MRTIDGLRPVGSQVFPRMKSNKWTRVAFVLAAAARIAMPSARASDDSVPTSVHRLTLEEYEATLRHWKLAHPQWITRETRGLTVDNLALHLLKITDSAVPDRDKQVVLVTALHSGPERTGATAALALADWLLSDDPEAAETRRKQIVLILPVMNPLAMFYTDRFGNAHKVDPYTSNAPGGKLWDPKTAELKRAEEAPEIVAVRGVIDQYHPEVHADLHGIGLQEYAPDQLGDRRMYAGQMMTEITGSAYSNYSLRPWDWRVTEAIIAAGRAAGFPSDRFEADAQCMLAGGELAALGKKGWSGSPLFYTAQYAYAKHHTMTLALEVAWEESAVARMRGLLRIGNNTWLDERIAGYPVNRVKNLIGQFVTAYGQTAAERRASRVELWNAQERFAVGLLYPQTVGRASLVCAVSDEAKAAVASGDFAKLSAALPALIGAGAPEVERFIASGPEIKLAMDNPPAQSASATPIEHGIGFRLRLSYRAPTKLEVRLNGAPLSESATDGFEAWFADGFTQVQVNVPPAKARAAGLFFLTCSFAPDVQHRGWLPPAPVLEQCRSAAADALPPTIAELAYGSHFHQTLDLWAPKSKDPTPVLVYLHGGGWAAEDKSNVHQHIDVRAFLDAGIAVASVNYRLLQDAAAAKIKPPIQWPIADAARAVQFLRSQAEKWNLEPRRFAATGVSAGAISSLWLAFHDDLADPASNDPVARQSTRLIAVAGKAPPTSLDPKQMREWIPNSIFGGHPFGFALTQSRAETFEQFLAARDSLLPEIQRYSPYALVTADAPPVFVEYPAQDKPPVPGTVETDPTHSAIFGLKLQQRLGELGVPCELHYPGAPPTEHSTLEEFLIDHLRSR